MLITAAKTKQAFWGKTGTLCPFIFYSMLSCKRLLVCACAVIHNIWYIHNLSKIFTLFFAELLKKTLLFHRFFDIICIRATVIHRSLPFPFNKNKGCFLRPNRRAAHTHLYAGFLC